MDRGSFYCKPGMTNLLPDNLNEPLCVDWAYMGRECTKGYRMCQTMHFNFDRIRNDADKQRVAEHITNTDGLWINKDTVRTLDIPLQKSKLGGKNGPGTQ